MSFPHEFQGPKHLDLQCQHCLNCYTTKLVPGSQIFEDNFYLTFYSEYADHNSMESYLSSCSWFSTTQEDIEGDFKKLTENGIRTLGYFVAKEYEIHVMIFPWCELFMKTYFSSNFQRGKGKYSHRTCSHVDLQNQQCLHLISCVHLQLLSL